MKNTFANAYVFKKNPHFIYYMYMFQKLQINQNLTLYVYTKHHLNLQTTDKEIILIYVTILTY